ncbi:MAG TPA: outer membrane lipoprotein-sorting protein [Ignavibacteriaceae bacterium]|nr:outer membrane lipoprotein-sorting protein [Ignavibacteriaceae bacterium]
MKKLILLIVILLTGNVLLAQSAEEIVKKAEDAIKGKTSRAEIEMIIETPDYTRDLKMDSWWVGNEKALIVTKAPVKERGNKTLKIKNEMWEYLKNTETTIKIPASMMLQSWNGSDFSNDDLVRESNLSKDYNQKIIAEEMVSGENTWKIQLLPKPDAPVVWGKIYYWVIKKNFLPSVVQYFDEKGNMIRYLVYSDVKNFHGRKIPSKWVMHNNKKNGHSTTIIINDIEYGINIPDRIFSFRELERGN